MTVRDLGLKHLNHNKIIDTRNITKAEYMQHLSPQEQKGITVTQNYDNLMTYRR